MATNNAAFDGTARSSRRRPLLLAAVAIATAGVLGPAMHGAHASGSVTLTPAVLSFPSAVAGGACVGSGCTYALVTVNNNTDGTVVLVGASASPNTVFFATFGGTCNVVDAYSIPAGTSCTFEWGFKPTRAGRSFGTGTINFDDGESPSVVLTGIGAPH